MVNIDDSTLIKTITEDCKTWEKLNGCGFYNYMRLNECENSKQNGMYQLLLNGNELWYGTLMEINAVVKSMIIMTERNG